MDERSVERLAELENARWSPVAAVGQQDRDESNLPAGEASASAPTTTGGVWSAYTPLGAPAEERRTDRFARFRFIRATAVGAILVVRFQWLPDPERREFLLHLDLSDQDNLDGASVDLFEFITFHIVDDPGWFPRDTTAISPRVSLYTPHTHE